ncbi:putative ribonuclease H-like domain-containing protein [Tanacetum coccineum]
MIEMDVKSAFLYGTLEEEVYVCQHPSFVDPQFLDKVYKVEKALYGLHQASRAWYESLSTYLLENGFRRGTIDKTLFIKKDKGDILLVQVKDDGISSAKKSMWCYIDEVRFATRETKQNTPNRQQGIAQDEEETKPKKLDSPFDMEAFSNSDYARASLDRKSTTGGCQFLGKRLISWQCKKQTIVANSTTKAEYVATANCCRQSSRSIPLITYETVIMEWEYRMERAATTASSLVAEQDSGNINKTQSMATLNESFPQGTDSGSGPRCQDTILGRGGGVQKLKLELKGWGRKQRKDSGPTEPIPDKDTNEEHISTPSYDPPQSGEDRLQLTELMSFCTSLQEKVLDLEKVKTTQAKEIASLKKRVKQLEKRKKSRTSRLKRLRMVSSASRVESSNDVSLGAQEDASKQGRKIANLDVNAEVTLIDKTQERNDEEMLFDVQDDLQGEEVVAEKEVAKKEVSAADPVTTASEVVTTANIEVTTASAPTTTIDELTLSQTLIEIKATKPKAVTTAATTTTTTRPKAKGVVVQEPSEFKTTSSPSQASQLPQAKDKGKAIMVKPEKSLKNKDQTALDEEVARNLKAQLQAELEEEERLARQKEEEATIALIESWDNT